MSDQDNQNNNRALSSPELRQQYLQAMGIQVWQSRFQPDTVVETVAENNHNAQAADIASVTTEVITKEPVSDWSVLENTISTCVACELHQTRTNAVASEGSHSASVMFITTAPVFNAESPSALLTAASSQLFTNMLKAIEIERADIFLTGLVKCQLAESREPRTTEILCCEQYLSQQIEMLKPELIVALGEANAQHLLVSKKPLQELTGKVYQYQSLPLMVMPSPEDLLINPQNKRQAWHQLLQIKQKLNG